MVIELVMVVGLIAGNGAVATLPKPIQEVGIASMFIPDPPHNNGKFACAGRTPLLPRRTHTKWTDLSMPICAHRTIPCGTWVMVENVKTGASSWCMVADRGPYGAKMPNGKWVVKKKSRPETLKAKFRGIIDLGPAVAKAVGTKGWAKVRIKWWPKNRRSSMLKLWYNLLDASFVTTWH